MRTKLVAILLAVTFLNVIGATSAGAKTFSGRGDVVDGDTLSVEGKLVNLFGIEAFVLGQKCWGVVVLDCGARAKMALEDAIAAAPVSCALQGEKPNTPLFAVCHASGRDSSEEMIRRGWALVRPDLAGSKARRLCELEAQAKRLRQGAWPYSFGLPFHHKGGQAMAGQVVSCGNKRLIVP